MGISQRMLCHGYHPVHQRRLSAWPKTLESVSKLRADLEEMQVQLALLKAETEQNIENAKEELRAAVAENVEARQRDGMPHAGRLWKKLLLHVGKSCLRLSKLIRKLLPYEGKSCLRLSKPIRKLLPHAGKSCLRLPLHAGRLWRHVSAR